MLILLVICIAVFGYLMGGINGAIITSKYIYKRDIREYGSGNPGLTNFLRVFGKGGAVLVIAIDILKTVIPVLVGGWLLGQFYDLAFLGKEIGGVSAMIGHAYPVYYGFKGGKTVLAGGTLILFLDWRVALIGWGLFVLMVICTRHVSLGSICAGISLPITVFAFGLGGIWEILVATVGGGLLVYRHKENIKRLIKGTESKFSFHRKRESGE